MQTRLGGSLGHHSTPRGWICELKLDAKFPEMSQSLRCFRASSTFAALSSAVYSQAGTVVFSSGRPRPRKRARVNSTAASTRDQRFRDLRLWTLHPKFPAIKQLKVRVLYFRTLNANGRLVFHRHDVLLGLNRSDSYKYCDKVLDQFSKREWFSIKQWFLAHNLYNLIAQIITKLFLYSVCSDKQWRWTSIVNQAL